MLISKYHKPVYRRPSRYGRTLYGAGFSDWWSDIKGVFSSTLQAAETQAMSLPGVQTAINTVKAKVGEFFQLPLRIAAAQKRGSAVLKVAQEKGMSLQAAEVSGLLSILNTLKSQYDSTETKLSTVLDQLKQYGFGFLPLIVATAVIAVAASVTYLINSVYKTERALDAVQSKVMTPDEASKFFGTSGILGSLGGFGTPLLIGGAVLAFFLFGRR